MSVLEMTFAQYFAEIVIIYKARDLMTGDNARRMLLDWADDVLLAYQEGTSPQEFYENNAARF